ncbi:MULTISPECIES: flagellar basal body rod protein FlgC [Actinosynnema]|uniref:Flagellar basal-body rod protein FlgC n=1 Tax=Actinosynnema pretiosum TaxID=42197 RepID=A0A290Z4N9_9PSEU|nr:flagellar basal body rod C-terminal domain-containing protein [Actinosynnema pretiosum]ATE53925.1 flagellar basal-body rod protein FlgC [Actinosynnema pretiosum]
MALFDSIGIAETGVSVHRKWLDAVADNIANVNNATSTAGPAFQARYVVARSRGEDGGVVVGEVLSGDAEGKIVYEPTNPLADANGNVRYPDIDLGEQMGHLIMAQRGYQANLAVVDRAKTAYEAALQLGRGA